MTREKPLLAFLERRGIPLEIRHTSGHASVADLKRLATALVPAAIVPIHSFGSARFDDLFEHAQPHPDGMWWEV